MQVVGKLVLEVLEVLVGRLVVRINHPDPSGVDQLRREGLNLIENDIQLVSRNEGKI